MKKTLAILLSLALVICMIPGMAFAAETPDPVSYAFNANYVKEFVYNGAPQVPVMAVDRTQGAETTTLPSANYTLEYYLGDAKVTSPTDVGVYTVKAVSSGQGELCSAQFAIKPVDLTRATITLTGDLTTAMVDTATSKLNSTGLGMVEVWQDGKELVAGADYTLDSKVVGSAAYILATAKTEEGTSNILASSKETAFAIKTVLTDAAIVDIPVQAYTGKEVKPVVTVQSPTYGYLREGIDYTVAYTNNVNATSAAIVKVTPIGNYTGGTLMKSFVIAQRSLKDYTVSITVPDAVYNDGSAVTVNETVYYGETKLIKGIDYTVSVNSTAVGSATVSITGYGNYKDTVTKTIAIVEKDKALSSSNTFVYIGGNPASSYNVAYNGSKQTPAVTVYTGATLQSSTVLSPNYYTVTYANNDKPGTAKIIINGRNGYAGSVEATFRIDATPMNQYNTTISGVASSYTYTGAYIAPEVTVRVNGVTLTKGKHYTVTYANNRNISTYSKARVTVTAIADSGYTGTVSQEFTIAGKSLVGCTAYFANGVSESEYTGMPVKPSIVVKEGAYTTLREYTDYAVSYKDASGKVVTSMKDAGTYTIVITGKNNYSGEKTLTYTIHGKDISHYVVTLNKYSAEATGSAQSVTVSSVKYGTSTLSSANYTVSYKNASGKVVTSMKEPGTYKVVVTGKGGYSGSAYATFVITGEPQTVTLNQDSSLKVYKDTDPFKVTAKATGDGTGFIFSSSNPEVASVNAYGVVTVHTIGRAKITATTVGMKKSEEASASFVVKVYPDKATISKKPWTEGKKGSLRVRWDIQEDATYYEVRYSRDKSFKKGTYKTKKVTASEKYDTQSTSLKELYSGKTYYVKVRAVKVVYNDFGEELKYYGKWSGWRSAKTK